MAVVGVLSISGLNQHSICGSFTLISNSVSYLLMRIFTLYRQYNIQYVPITQDGDMDSRDISFPMMFRFCQY